MSAASFRRDAEELLRLAQLTESQNVKRILAVEAEKLQNLAEVEEKRGGTSNTATPKVVKKNLFITKIANYAWDQSDKYLKFYVTLNGVHNLPAENISTEYSTKSFELSVIGTDNKNNVLAIKDLLHEIVPVECYHKVKTDMVALYLKKSIPKHWSYITEAEKKTKEPKTPKFDKDADPSASLMNFMKKMYEDGDDDMKRTIAKAWVEARDKQSPEEFM